MDGLEEKIENGFLIYSELLFPGINYFSNFRVITFFSVRYGRGFTFFFILWLVGAQIMDSRAGGFGPYGGTVYICLGF